MANGNESTPVVVEECPPARPKIKHDWYQTETDVVITILLKNAPKDKIKVNYGITNLSLSSPISDSESEYSLELELSHPIVPEQCSHNAMASKIEVKLRKKDGLRWNTLEGEPGNKGDNVKPIPQAIINASGPQTTKYPSSCPFRRDWDKIEKDIIKQEEEEKPEGEQALKKLFEQIYGQGSDEVKKAMNKSYMESGGTVLSTNWNDVAKDKVDVKPPDGMEWKKWES